LFCAFLISKLHFREVSGSQVHEGSGDDGTSLGNPALKRLRQEDQGYPGLHRESLSQKKPVHEV
jgi:hypothetical protein